MSRQRLLLRLGLVGLAALVGGVGGHKRANDTGPFGSARLPSAEDNQRLEGALAVTLANVTWVFGAEGDVRKLSEYALSRLPPSETEQRARLLIRMGMVVESPDGQGALFHAACTTDAQACSGLGEIAAREAKGRSVAPGNRLPLALIPGHPPIDGK